MRAAPAVSVDVSGGLPWRLARTLIPAAATAAVAAWGLQHLLWSPATAAAAFTLVVALAATVAWRRARPVVSALAFDGQRWTCDGQEGRVDLMLDLDRFLLLRWTPRVAASPRWLGCTASEARTAFHGLRVALYAAQPTQPA